MRQEPTKTSADVGADLRGCALGQIGMNDASLLSGATNSARQAFEFISGFGLSGFVRIGCDYRLQFN